MSSLSFSFLVSLPPRLLGSSALSFLLLLPRPSVIASFCLSFCILRSYLMFGPSVLEEVFSSFTLRIVALVEAVGRSMFGERSYLKSLMSA